MPVHTAMLATQLAPFPLPFIPMPYRLVTPTPPDPRREALPVRMALVEVERQLEHVATAGKCAVCSGGAGSFQWHAASMVCEPAGACGDRRQVLIALL